MRRISSRPWGLLARTRTERAAEIKKTQPVMASWLSRLARSAQDVTRAASTEKATAMMIWKLSRQSHDALCDRPLSFAMDGKNAADAQRQGDSQRGRLRDRGAEEDLVAGDHDHSDQGQQHPDQPADQVAVVKEVPGSEERFEGVGFGRAVRRGACRGRIGSRRGRGAAPWESGGTRLRARLDPTRIPATPASDDLAPKGCRRPRRRKSPRRARRSTAGWRPCGTSVAEHMSIGKQEKTWRIASGNQGSIPNQAVRLRNRRPRARPRWGLRRRVPTFPVGGFRCVVPASTRPSWTSARWVP